MDRTKSIGSTSLPNAGSQAAEAGAAQEGFSRSLRNVLWMSSSGVLTRIFNLLRGIVLARLLTPFDFGIYGLGVSIVGVKERIADIGAGNFLVYRPDDIQEHVETTFWVNLALSSFLLALLAVAAPLLGKLYHEALLVPVLVILGLGIWARINASIHQNLLRTEGRFRALGVIDNVSNAAWLAIAVVLAWKGFGVWALVASALCANLILAALLIFTQGWRPRGSLSRNSLRLLGRFSFWYLGQGIAWYLVGNLDNLLVGRFLGISLLGFYAIAFNYALVPITTIGNSMGNVAYAELPRLYGQPELFWEAFLRYSRVLALVGCFAAFAALVSAPDIFPILFGHRWDAAIVPFEILSLYAVVRCVWLDPFQAYGNFKTSCITGIVTVAAAAGAILFGLRYGLAGAAWAMVAIQLGFHVISLMLMTRSWRKLLDAVRTAAPYVGGGAAAALIARGFRHWVLVEGTLPRVITLIFTLTVYIAMFLFLFRNDVRSVLKSVIGSRNPGTVA